MSKVNPIKCQAKNPSACRYHGLMTPKGSTGKEPSFTEDAIMYSTSPIKNSLDSILPAGSVSRKMFDMFLLVNEEVKDELCENPNVVNVEDVSGLTTGYTFPCRRCEKTHYFTSVDYDRTSGRKAMTYLYRQLPDDKKAGVQYLTPIMSLQMASLDESFTHHYKNERHKLNIINKLNKRLKFAAATPVFNVIKVPENVKNQDWGTLADAKKFKSNLPYIEPSQVPKEILYKFSQCLRKKQHDSAELAHKSMIANKQSDKEVYLCPHCQKYHYGRSIDPNRTEEERYEFAKKTWAMPVYREAVSLVIQSYGLLK